LGLRGTILQENGEDYTTRNFYDKYSSPHIIQNQMNDLVWHVGCVNEEKRCMLGFGWEL